jgi:protein HIRA/HIR1
VTTANICSVVALGSDDLAVSIWQTKSARPIIVAKDVFERPVMDLSWSVTMIAFRSNLSYGLCRSLDGLTLYACSSDGTICIFDFDESELEGIAPLSVQAEYLKLFNFIPPPIAQAYVPQPRTADYGVPSVQARTPFPPVPAVPIPFSSQSSSQAQNASGRKKRRIKPVFVSHLSSAPGINGVPTASSQPSVNGVGVQPFHPSPAPQPFGMPHRSGTNLNSLDMITPTIPNSYGPSIHNDHPGEYTDRFAIPSPSPGEPPLYLPSTPSRFIETNGPQDDRDKAEMWDSLPENGTSNANGINRIAKARTLGGDRRRESVSVIKEIRPPAPTVQG